MFIDSSMISPMAPFEGADDNGFVNHSRIPPLLRTEPGRGVALRSINIPPLTG